ncbi:MAG: glutaredoxin family protein [Chthoniobacterales bacterium]
MPEELVLYVKKTCPWCIAAESWLDQKGYAYREIDVNQSQASYSEMQKISGQRFVPTLVVGDKHLADFDTAQLEQFLKTEDIRPAK